MQKTKEAARNRAEQCLFSSFFTFFSMYICDFVEIFRLNGNTNRMTSIRLFLPLCLMLAFSVAGLSQTATVTVREANLRDRPTMKGNVLVTIANGTSLELIKKKGGWFLVRNVGLTGWIHGNTITFGDDEQVPNKTTGQSPVAEPLPEEPILPKGKPDTRTYLKGPRGGCYFVNSKGNKSYVDRALCS